MEESERVDEENTDENLKIEDVSSRLGMRRESCLVCSQPVFLAEKLVVARSVYHRGCFRCARCRHQLTPGGYYETEDGQYCCESCPDEEDNLRLYHEQQQQESTRDDEPQPVITADRRTSDATDTPTSPTIIGDVMDVMEAPLSDEEKTKRQSLELLQRSAAALSLAEDVMDSVTSPESEELDFREGVESLKLEEEEDDVTSSDSPDASTVRRGTVEVDNDEPDVNSAPENSPTQVEDDTVNNNDNNNISDDTNDSEDQKSSLIGTDLDVSPTQDGPKEEEEKEVVEEKEKVEEVDRVEETEVDDGSKNDVPMEPNTKDTDESKLPDEKLSLPEVLVSAPEQQRVEKRPPRKKSRGKKAEKLYPEELNPFGDDEEDEEAPGNPFGDEEDEEDVPGNPFGDEEEDEEVVLRNVHSPSRTVTRTQRHDNSMTLQPSSNLSRGSLYSSNTSITSSCSTMTYSGTYRKKKPAPPPPVSPNTSNSVTSPAKSTPRTRKTKPAPPPPPVTSSATNSPLPTITDSRKSSEHEESPEKYANSRQQRTSLPLAAKNLFPNNDNNNVNVPDDQVWADEKLSKDEANRNTQNLTASESMGDLPYDKSIEGKWKRKKGPAPSRPIPLKRKIKVMSVKDVKLELDQIEMQQQGLEKQGVRLEQIIRDKCESGNAIEDSSLSMDVEELVLELFALVNEKNELFRRQAELMLLRRQQRLEEEHADIEYQIRCLMIQPEATKTDCDKQREEGLIQRLVEIVERRNEIVECLEMDRRREVEEDKSIHREMDLYAARNKTDIVNMTDESLQSSKLKKGKTKEKSKEKKAKKSGKKDADKDIDETEVKVKIKRKWF